MRNPNTVRMNWGNSLQDPGATHRVLKSVRVEDVTYEPGDLVCLTVPEAKSFVDRVEALTGQQAPKPAAPAKSHREVRDELRAEAAAKEAAKAAEQPAADAPAEEAKTESKPRRQRG